MTPAFIHFMGADEMLAEQGPDALADALDAVIRIVERAAHELQVAFFETDIAPSGGKVMLMAGAPRSTGNDEEAMLRAMRAVIDADSPLPLRIGVNWGRIFVSDFGPAYRRTYSVKGDAVNLAARLMAKAEPGQILTTDDVLERARTRFDAVALEPFEAKGKSEPVQAYVVGPPLGLSTAPLDRAGRPRERVVTAARDARPRSPLRGTDRRARGRAGHGEVKAGRGATLNRATDIRVSRSSARSTTRPRPTSLSETSPPRSRGYRQVDRSAERLLVERASEALRISIPWLPLLGVPIGLELPDTRRPRRSKTVPQDADGRSRPASSSACSCSFPRSSSSRTRTGWTTPRRPPSSAHRAGSTGAVARRRHAPRPAVGLHLT